MVLSGFKVAINAAHLRGCPVLHSAVFCDGLHASLMYALQLTWVGGFVSEGRSSSVRQTNHTGCPLRSACVRSAPTGCNAATTRIWRRAQSLLVPGHAPSPRGNRSNLRLGASGSEAASAPPEPSAPLLNASSRFRRSRSFSLMPFLVVSKRAWRRRGYRNAEQSRTDSLQQYGAQQKHTGKKGFTKGKFQSWLFGFWRSVWPVSAHNFPGAGLAKASCTSVTEGECALNRLPCVSGVDHWTSDMTSRPIAFEPSDYERKRFGFQCYEPFLYQQTLGGKQATTAGGRCGVAVGRGGWRLLADSIQDVGCCERAPSRRGRGRRRAH